MRQKDIVARLNQRLQIEYKKLDRSGIYGFTQRIMAYNSNRIEGSTLTEDQTASMFDTGTLYSDDPDFIFKTKDIEEMNGHFKMFNYMLQTLHEPLSEDIIKTMHQNLKEGVFEDKANGYAIGKYKTRSNRVSSIETSLPQNVASDMANLLEEYHTNTMFTPLELAKFHAKFENIHPFQDGNGRVGRMILLRECLNHNLYPIVIQDVNKAEYYRHLNNAQTKNNFQGLLQYFYKEQLSYLQKALPYFMEYTELESLEASALIDESQIELM